MTAGAPAQSSDTAASVIGAPAGLGRRGRLAITAVLILAAGLFAAGVEIGAARSLIVTHDAAAVALARGDYASSLALDRAVAQRTGPLYVLAGGISANAALATNSTTVAWANALAAAGQTDAAIALLGPLTTDDAVRDRSKILFGAAQNAHDGGDDVTALTWLDELTGAHPPPELVAQAIALRPGLEVSAAAALSVSGHANDAVTLLDAAIAAVPAGDTGDRARALLPSALLAAGNEAMAAQAVGDAVSLLTRLSNDFPGSVPARTARALLAAPQPVVGTLALRDGTPISGDIRLSSHFRPFGSSYVTSGPFFRSTADANGDFRFNAIPLGGPYVLEVLSGNSWTTLIDPATSKPADAVSVTALTPTDLTYIVMPA